MPDTTAESALAAFTTKLNLVAQPMRQTLTYDQGKEMARHRELAVVTDIRVYFCDPHSLPGVPAVHAGHRATTRRYHSRISIR